MLKNISIFVIFSFFSTSVEQATSRSYENRRGYSSSRRSFGEQRSRASVWDKCSKQTITDGEIKCDINNGRGDYSIETAVCSATCKDGYLLIGTTFDVLFNPCNTLVINVLVQGLY